MLFNVVISVCIPLLLFSVRLIKNVISRKTLFYIMGTLTWRINRVLAERGPSCRCTVTVTSVIVVLDETLEKRNSIGRTGPPRNGHDPSVDSRKLAQVFSSIVSISTNALSL